MTDVTTLLDVLAGEHLIWTATAHRLTEAELHIQMVIRCASARRVMQAIRMLTPLAKGRVYYSQVKTLSSEAWPWLVTLYMPNSLLPLGDLHFETELHRVLDPVFGGG